MDYYAGMRAFVRAVELGSFSKAADEAGVKVSTVSRYVSGLEADLGAAILNRSTRSLHLTEAGQVFYERSVRVLSDVEEARDAVRSLNARPQGLLRVALPSAFGRRHVMPHMRAFLSANPDVRLDATLADTSVDLIEAGIDVAVRIGVMADSNFIAKRLASETFVIVGSSGYLSNHPEPQTPTDLAGHECLLSNSHASRAWHFRKAAEPDDSSSEIEVGGRMRTNDLEVLRQAVIEGGGIALLPAWLCHSELQDGRMRAVLPQWTWSPPSGLDRAIWALYPPKKIVSPKVKAFLAFLGAQFSRASRWESDPLLADRPAAGSSSEQAHRADAAASRRVTDQ